MSRSPRSWGSRDPRPDSLKSEEATYAVPRSAMGRGVDDAELPVPHGQASLGGGPGDGPLAPKPGRQGLDYERRQADQSTLLHAQAGRYDERQAAQRGVDDSPQGLRGRWEVLLRSIAAREGRDHVRDHGERRRVRAQREDRR